MDRQRPPFTLEQMRTFVAVAELEHVTRAAHSLGLTQGAVTQQVRLLEKALGVRLLERVGRNVQLSDAGRTVAAACRAATRGIDQVVEAARLAASGEVGSVHVGASATAAAFYIDAPLADFVSEMPRVHLQVTVASTARVCEEIGTGILDAGCVEDPLPTGSARSLLSVKVADDEVVLVARPDHPLTGYGRVRARDLAGHRFLAREEGTALDAVARTMLGPAYDHLSRLELGALDAVRSGALAGLGFAVLPKVAVADELADGRLRLLAFPLHRRAINAVRRRSGSSATVEAFWQVMVRRAQRKEPVMPSTKRSRKKL